MGGLGDVYVFITDNVFGALLGVAWGYCFPVVTSTSQYAWIQALSHDIVGTLVLSLVTYHIVKKFDRELDKVVEGGAAEEAAETTKKAKFTSAVRFEVHVMIVEGFSLALGSLHATFAEEVWEAVSYYITNGESTGGDCVLAYKTAQVIGALVVGLAVCAIFTSLSFYACEASERAVSMPWATVWKLIATSFSYAIGWSFFTALDLSMGCLPGNMNYYLVTQLTRAVPFTIVGVLVYFKLIAYIHRRQPFTRTDIFIDIIKDVVYTILTLSWINVYETPIDYFYSTTTAQIVCYSIALALTAGACTIVYFGVFNMPPKDHPSRPLVCWTELCKNFAEWLIMFAWWDPLDTSFDTFYTGSGWLNTGEHPVSSYFFSILAALFVTGMVAAMVASIAILDPQLDRLEALPDWAIDLLEDKKGGGGGAEPASEATALLTDADRREAAGDKSK